MGGGQVTLGADSTPLEKVMAAVQAKFLGFAGMVAKIGAQMAAAGVASIGVAAKSFANWGESIYQASRQTGAGFGEIINSMAGLRTSSEGTVSAFVAVDGLLNRIAMGSMDSARSLSVLGLRFSDLVGLGDAERIERIADALDAIPSTSQRAALQRQVLGGLDIDVSGGSAGMRARASRDREGGGIVSALDVTLAKSLSEAFRDLGVVASGIFRTVGSVVGPILQPILSWLRTGAVYVREFIESWVPYARGVGEIITSSERLRVMFWSVVESMKTVISTLYEFTALGQIIPWVTEQFAKFFATVGDAIIAGDLEGAIDIVAIKFEMVTTSVEIWFREMWDSITNTGRSWVTETAVLLVEIKDAFITTFLDINVAIGRAMNAGFLAIQIAWVQLQSAIDPRNMLRDATEVASELAATQTRLANAAASRDAALVAGRDAIVNNLGTAENVAEIRAAGGDQTDPAIAGLTNRLVELNSNLESQEMANWFNARVAEVNQQMGAAGQGPRGDFINANSSVAGSFSGAAISGFISAAGSGETRAERLQRESNEHLSVIRRRAESARGVVMA